MDFASTVNIALVFAFILGFVGASAYFVALSLHPSWDEEASEALRKIKRSRRVLLLLFFCIVGGITAATFQYKYTETLPIQSILVGFHWPTLFRAGKSRIIKEES